MPYSAAPEAQGSAGHQSIWMFLEEAAARRCGLEVILGYN